MEDEKNIKINSILKYGRPLICFIICVMIIFFYCLNAKADTPTTQTISSKYGVTFASNQNSYLVNVLAQANANSISNSVLNFKSNGISLNYAYNIFASSSRLYNSESNISSYVNNFSLLTSITIDSVVYDLSNSYVLLTTYSNSLFTERGTECYVLPSDSKVVVVDGYFVSQSPFYKIYQNQLGNWVSQNVNTVSANGFYCSPVVIKDNFNTSTVYPCIFTDMDMYFQSNNGVTGHTNFSTTSTDFDFSAENYNFNYLKTGGVIVSPADPVEEVDNFGEYAKSRMNFSMNSYYTGGKLLNSAKHRVTINWPDVVRENPENFYLKVEYTGKYKDDSLATTITFTRSLLHGQRYRLIPITTIMSNNNGQLPSSFSIDVGLGSLVDANNKSMFQYFLDSVSAFSGVSDPSSNNIWMNFLNTVGEAIYNFIYGEDDDLPLAQLARDIDSYIDVMEIEGYVSIMYDKDSTNYITGANHSKFNFKNGNSETLGTDNTINQYPEENQSEYQLPSSQNGNNQVINQNAPVAYGGVVQLENNINAMIEYLFNIDASDYLNIVGNTHSAIQETFNTLTNTSQNGAWAIMEQSYALIPDEIWGWIKSAVAVILGGSIISWVMYFRVKKG